MKILNVLLLTGIMVFSGALLCPAQEDTMTNAQFANILVDVLGLEMPADADALSDAELFEVQANMLAEAGITLFVDANPDTQTTRGAVANVLYGALIGPSDATTEDKIDHLASLGYLGTGAADGVMNSAEVIAALNVPALSTAVAEAYSPAGTGIGTGRGRGRGIGMGLERGRGIGIVPPGPPANPPPEGPASPI